MSSSANKPSSTGMVTPRRYSTMTTLRNLTPQGKGNYPQSPLVNRNFSNPSTPMFRSNSTQLNFTSSSALDLGLPEAVAASPGTLDRYPRPSLLSLQDASSYRTDSFDSAVSSSSKAAKFSSSGGGDLPLLGNDIITSIRIRPINQPSNNIWTHGPVPNDLYGREYIRQDSSSNSSALQQEYMFNHVFGMESDNSSIYQKSVASVVRNVFCGYNGIVFAYGMTGTGKTYSMQGTEDEPGIIPLGMRDLFDMVESNADSDTFQIRISYLEIYNERIRDLISNSQEEPKVREGANGEVIVSPMTRVLVTSPEEVSQVIEQCNAIRKTAATDYNTYSSRSHAILQVFLIRNSLSTHTTRTSTLSLVDLAGSERASTDHERRKEGAFINKSLLTLGTVISRLSNSVNGGSSSSNNHIPYRESKLTRLLQQSLSGQSQISLLATISIEARHAVESTNTLKFAMRTQNLPTEIRQAEASTNYQAEVTSLRAALAKSNQELELFSNTLKQLKSDLEERDAYISWLEAEKSHESAISRVRLRMEELLSDRNMEIADLKEDVNDKEKIIYALRSSQRRRELAELNQSKIRFSRFRDLPNRKYEIDESEKENSTLSKENESATGYVTDPAEMDQDDVETISLEAINSPPAAV
ncbi:kinesin-like protein Tea2 [Schizosaccharomyces cryophilus OY26]|uniref:Kinesin-like protein n=1 Tax=Schizosaccharomyces cryophilus (strain OY26 / ATCC MYA-4695 / CBS 11777 / NBRC 106824 / NRRL Y48691) TaxID=653667 RepID=S9W129_SCHCR|nr:kinesin-like protein Tea2 [Schizosaccharomyces cryophilus OY26]EPY53618.1 kinesin-like protein Tea2 [Schizosaccharomyces cryophilus OY26]